MDQSERDFINFLLEQGVLKTQGDFTLKSKRSSPYFINVGDLDDGVGISALGEQFASLISSKGKNVDVLYGPAYKGIPLAVATSIAMELEGHGGVRYAFDRKEVKDYGEATGGDLQKKVLIGTVRDRDHIWITEDVFTTGQTKYDALDLLGKMADDISVDGLVIAVDRQEVGVNGRNAIAEFSEKTKIPVSSIVSASDIYNFLVEENRTDEAERIGNYLRSYGTQSARRAIGKLEESVVTMDKSVIPACDVATLEELEEIVSNTADIDKIGAYKIGFELALAYGLPRVVETIRNHTDKSIIYDHQKGGTDIPATGKKFARVCKESGVDAIILFPQAGPETERAWIYHALNEGLGVIIGGRMTHPAYSESEGGFITDKGAMEMYRIAARAGIINFVVPGNKPEVIEEVKGVIEEEGISDPIFYAPGFIAQGGNISEAAKVAGPHFHGIVGSGIYKSQDKRAAALELTSQL